MLTSAFDFDLPDRLIAQRPAPRGTSRLLVLGAGDSLEHAAIADLPRLLQPGDLLVVNDTRVIPARLFARRAGSGGRVELLLVERLDALTWTCLTKPGRKSKPETVLALTESLSATVIGKETGGLHRIRFSEPVEPHLDALGAVPLPPYIKRPAEADDQSDYQTIFATAPGAIAAPTAGLHFTGELIERLRDASVELAHVTLHVGIGTFKPVTAELVHEHRMDSERYEISAETAAAIGAARKRRGRVVAVGTTVVRTLESAAAGGGEIEAGSGRTELFIRPGFRFRAVDALLTNFHLPRSTLLMLVSALAGQKRLLRAYAEAIEHGYRFYSYGDAMLIDVPQNPRS